MSKFALLFLLLFFSGVVATLTYSGVASFLLYQLVYFLNPDARWWSAQIPGISYSFVAAVLMLASLALGYRRYTEKSPWGGQPALKWMLVLLLFYYLSYVFFALVPVMHKRFTIDFTKLVIIVFTAYKLLSSEKALNASVWAYLIGATYIGYLATITGRNSGDRVEGIGVVDSPDANGVAAALVPAGVLLLYYAWMGGWKLRLLAVVCGALIANGLVLINSRGAFLGTVAGVAPFLLLMFFSRHQQKGQKATALLIALFGISGALYVTDDQFWERMQTLQNLESKESGAGRVTFWLKTFDMLEDHPMGMGVDGYNLLAPVYMDEETRGGVEHRSVHSLWFQGLSEVGPLGFLAFLAMLGSLYRVSRKARRWVLEAGDNRKYFQLRALECALFSYLVAGSFINQFRAEILYWMILLLAAATNVFYLQHVRSREKGLSGSRRRNLFPGQPAGTS